MKLLAADIGGTKTLLALAEHTDDGIRVIREQRYDSGTYPDFETVLADFLARLEPAQREIRRACFAVAGPVITAADSEMARVTNLSWRLDNRRLAATFALPSVRLINDFQAVGHGIELLGENDLVILQPGRPRAAAPRAVLGAGTGLGTALLAWDGARYRVLPTEGGHVDFAPNGAVQRDLLVWLAQRYDHVSIERLLSGPGLVAIHEYLCARHPDRVDTDLARRMQNQDAAAAVTEHALTRGETLAGEALELFVSIYGAHAGNLALLTLPYGGLYIAGGIAPRILPRLADGRFLAAFNHKGRMSHLTAEIPIAVVINPKVGLLGAAGFAAHAAG
ncbi:MAG: glucokinase [Gammaproteobacteria bacterium]|nr:glucokinase [Gammaproteobacteria bacterium]